MDAEGLMAKPDRITQPPAAPSQSSATVPTTAAHKPHPAEGRWLRIATVPSLNYPLHQLEELTVAPDGAISLERLTHPDRMDIVLAKGWDRLRGGK